MGALPAALRRITMSRRRMDVSYTITRSGMAANPGDLPPRATLQRRLLELFRKEQVVTAEALRRLAPTSRAALQQLTARGWVEIGPRAEAPLPAFSEIEISRGPALTAEQAAAANAVTSAFGRFEAFVLHGVTGSGKTEVYLQCMGAALRAELQSLLLVPEIGLTPQLEALVRARFPSATVALLHSRLSETERLRHWRAAQAGSARVVLATRLGVFAPMPRLGLIVVDEEHDPSFKQTDAMRYSARDLAVVRAHQMTVPVILGSATPALETYHNAVAGRYRLLQLTHRVGALMPEIECIDTRGERLDEGLSQALLAAISERLGSGEQSLVFINRRGYAPALLCRSCDWLAACHRCSARLVLHLQERRLHCHHCGFEQQAPAVCPGCGNQDLAPLGQGTQRVEAALVRHFPNARVLRIDRDSTRRKLSWPAMREQIRARKVDILVGTQMLAKGHDFPHLNLVGVLNSDNQLFSTDFRAPERLYALLTQVAGRAGRGNARGRVMIQTEFPHHRLYAALRLQDYAAFAADTLEERRQAGFPPFVHQALLRAEAARLDTALKFLADAARIGETLAQHVTIFDPVPAAMVRKAGRERAQLLVQAPSRRRLQEFLARWHERLCTEPSAPARWSLDVDPLDF
jgi:primosomal protein N' (replication factor Y)